MDGLLNTFRNLGPTRIIMLIAVTLVTMGMLAVLVTRINAPNFALLYGNLDSKTASQIVTSLEQQNIPYEVRGESAIYVPQDKVSTLRLKIAGEGMVGGSQGGYEILDNASSFGTTALVQDINARRSLEGELARTIMSIPAVQSARVHLVMPKKRVFMKDDTEATASVTLDLGNRVLAPEQVQAITHLVAAAVPSLQPKKVTVVDNRGNLLTDDTDTGNSTAAMTAANKYKETLEGDYAAALTKMLERVVGIGKVSVKVNADVDFDRIEENAELYDPQQQVVRSEQQVEENSSSSAGGDNGYVGASSNLPAGGAEELPPALVSPKDTTSRTEATTNYEISKTVRKSVKEGGRIKRMSVAVLVEGKYDTVDGKSTYVPWSADDIAKFRSLVQSSIGYDEVRGDKIEVLDLPFSAVPEEEAVSEPLLTKNEIMSLLQYALLVIGLVLMGLFVIRPLLRVISSPVAMAPAGAAGPIIAVRAPAAGMPSIGTAPAMVESDEPLINLDKVAGKVRESSIRKVGEIVSQHTDESISVIRQWVATGTGSSNTEER